jgi:hypothetical protein
VSSHGTEASPTTKADAEDDPLKQRADREAPAPAARIREVVARCPCSNSAPAAAARWSRPGSSAPAASAQTTGDATPSAETQAAPPPHGNGSDSPPSTETAAPASGAARQEPGTRLLSTCVPSSVATTATPHSTTSQRSAAHATDQSTHQGRPEPDGPPRFLKTDAQLPVPGFRERNSGEKWLNHAETQ